MRIVNVITGLMYGGAEVQMLELSTRMRDRGHAVSVVSITPLGGLVNEFTSRGISVESLNISRGRPDPRAVYRLARILRKADPDVVHSFMVHSNLLTRITRIFARKPILVNTALGFSESSSSSESPWFREFLYRITDRLSDVTTQVSRACAARYVSVRAVPVRKIRTIPCGVDVNKFHQFDDSGRRLAYRKLGEDCDFRWLTVGRLVDFKDHPTAIRAFSLASKGRSRVEFIIRGDGPNERQITDLIEHCEVKEEVRLMLERCEIAELMNGADAFVLSSVSEGMPTVALEAAACGLPIVATDVGGNSEVVQDGVNGFIVPPNNPEALAETMKTVMDMTETERRKMAAAGRIAVEEQYNFDLVAGQYEQLYESLAAKKRARTAQ